jgi:hypothetical protein
MFDYPFFLLPMFSALTDSLSEYMQARFTAKLRGTNAPANPSLHLSLPMLYECERITDMLVAAFNNKCKESELIILVLRELISQ